MEKLDRDDRRLFHLFKPLALEDTVLLVVHVIEKWLISQTLDLHDFEWLLDLEYFPYSAWHCVVFQIVARAFTSDDLDFTLLNDSDFELV